MYISKKIKVLIVDDSLLFREVMAKRISEDPAIEVVGTAADPFEARDKIIEFEPDVMTLDVEMPKMNGIEFLRRLIPQYPIPVVVVSSVGKNVFDALGAGAVDFVTKPDSGNSKNIEGFIGELIVKIKIASMAKVKHLKKEVQSHNYSERTVLKDNCKIIAIGASTGGTEAIFKIISSLPGEMPGIVIVQHMPPVFTKMFADRLNNSCRLEVKEAEHGDKIIPGRVLIAPGGDRHMRIKTIGNSFTVECFNSEKVNGHCPSIDILFNSVAEKAGAAAIGVILTGMGYDGAKGLLNMRRKGARTIGQDEKSSIVYGMPKAAFNIGAVEKQASIEDIHKLIFSMIRK